jgi:hypothetical protein
MKGNANDLGWVLAALDLVKNALTSAGFEEDSSPRHNLSIGISIVKKTLADLEQALKEQNMKVTDEMVNRFLTWPLPKSVDSDVCVTKDYGQRSGIINVSPNRTGTNLLTADEARQMLEHVLGEQALNERKET